MSTAEDDARKAKLRNQIRLGDIYGEIVNARKNNVPTVTIMVKDKDHFVEQVITTLRNSGYIVTVKGLEMTIQL